MTKKKEIPALNELRNEIAKGWNVAASKRDVKDIIKAKVQAHKSYTTS